VLKLFVLVLYVFGGLWLLASSRMNMGNTVPGPIVNSHGGSSHSGSGYGDSDDVLSSWLHKKPSQRDWDTGIMTKIPTPAMLRARWKLPAVEASSQSHPTTHRACLLHVASSLIIILAWKSTNIELPRHGSTINPNERQRGYSACSFLFVGIYP
jgi:hypothetical protein